MEPLKTFVLDRDDFEEANNIGYSGGDRWRGTVPATLTEEVLRRIAAATLADHVAFTEMLQQHKEDFSSLLQHMADCYKGLLTDNTSCTSTSVAIIHLLTGQTSLRIFMQYVRILIQLTC